MAPTLPELQRLAEVSTRLSPEMGAFGSFRAFSGVFWRFWAFLGVFRRFRAFSGVFDKWRKTRREGNRRAGRRGGWPR